MILDLPRFVETERPHWKALEASLLWLERNPDRQFTVDEATTFHALYRRAADDLARVKDFAGEGDLQQYLSWLVSRAYAEIHETRHPVRFRPWHWFSTQFPSIFRRHVAAFYLTVLLTVVGSAFGALAIRFDPDAKQVLMPFDGLRVTPSERVAREQKEGGEQVSEHKNSFSAQLMTHNTQVSLTTLALGITFGFGTVIVLFYNGVILGAVAMDYVADGQTTFLLGWLLPHGVIEIPAILIAGQAGFVLASALIGWNDRSSRAHRLRQISGDVVTLAGGVALMLIWAGVIEAFVSQYHEPVLPYGVKIAFGIVEFLVLLLFLGFAGRERGASNGS